MPVRIVSAGGGGVTLSAASTGSEFTATLPANTGTVVTTASSAAVTPAMLTQPLTLMTAQASTSGTSIDFTGIPSWARRITVIFSGVSTNGNSDNVVRIGSGSVVATGYVSWSSYVATANSTNATSSSTAFHMNGSSPGSTKNGVMQLHNVSGNLWVSSHTIGDAGASVSIFGGGNLSLSGLLDRIRITTANGTDTFDAGSINIMYEG